MQGERERTDEAAQRTPEQQLARLDARLGVGQGAERERAKLLRQIKQKAS